MKHQNTALHAFAVLVWVVSNDFCVSWSIFVKAFRALDTY